MNRKKLIYIGFAFKHHNGTKAGYHHIKDYLIYDKIIDCQWEHNWLNYPLSNYFMKVIRKIYTLILGYGYTITIIKCIYLSLLYKNQVFHFIYAENTYKWLHRFKRKTNTIVCTYHQPINVFLNNPKWIDYLKHIDKIILMSPKDILQFRQWTGKDNVYYIPHGINTDFYKPDYSAKKYNNILMVGNWLRDFKFANNIFNLLIKNRSDLSITIVSNECNFSHFQKTNNLHLLSNISDEKLRSLYRTSKCLFLPLESFTANNAILEAAATGCPIVIATNNIDTTYLNEKQIDFISLEIEKAYKHLTSILDNEYNSFKIKEVSQFIANNYSWHIIAKQTKKVFRN